MPIAIATILVGYALTYQALTGESLVSLFSSQVRKLNPAGGRGGGGSSVTPSAPDDDTPDYGQTGQFRGPHAALLYQMSQVAQHTFHLRISQICRPKDATYGAPDSLHKQCRAFDATGNVTDRVAFARYVRGIPGIDEVFCDQAGMIAPGYDHSDHVHVGA
jgi:hypothetical protein